MYKPETWLSPSKTVIFPQVRLPPLRDKYLGKGKLFYFILCKREDCVWSHWRPDCIPPQHCSSPFLVLGMNALAENNSYAFLGPFLSLDMRQFHTVSCAREFCQSKHAVSPLQGIHQTWEKNGGHTCRRSTKIYLLVAMFQRSGLTKWRQDLCGSLANWGLCV